MATDANDESTGPKDDSATGDIEVTVRKPLLAVMCIAESGSEIDTQAKTIDYENSIFTMNHMLKHGCVYQALNDEATDDSDEKCSDKFEHHPNQMEHNKILDLKLKTSWKSEEMMAFCRKVVETIEDDKNGYDCLFFLLTSCAKPNQKEVDKEFYQISDSFGKLVNLSDICQLFDKNHCKCDALKFARVFMVDRYFEWKEKAQDIKSELEDFNEYTLYKFSPPKMENIGPIMQIFGQVKPLALVNSDQTGGVISRAMKKEFIKKPPKSRDGVICGNTFDSYLSNVTSYVARKFKVGVPPVNPSSQPFFEFTLDIW